MVHPLIFCDAIYSLTCFFHCALTHNLVAFLTSTSAALGYIHFPLRLLPLRLTSLGLSKANERQTADGLCVFGSQKCVYHVPGNIYVKDACAVLGRRIALWFNFG